MREWTTRFARSSQAQTLLVLAVPAILFSGRLAYASPGPGCEPVPAYLAGTDGQHLVAIDPTNGQSTAVSNAGLAGVAPDVAGLAYDAATATLYAVDLASGYLVSIDPENGLGLAIGPIGFSGVHDLAVQPGTGILYGVDAITGELVTIDKATGAGTSTTAAGLSCVAGLEFDPATQLLYATDNCTGTLIRIDVLDGTQTPIGPLGFTNVVALAADAGSGQMYAVDAASEQLITVDLATGAGGVKGPLGFASVRSLAIDGPGARTFAVSTDLDALLRVDLSSGAATTIRRVGANTLKGLAFDPESVVLYGADASTNQLIRIDARNGDSAIIGSFGASVSIAGLALHPDTRVLYACDRLNNQLVQIDSATAQVTPVGPFGSAAVSGLAFDDAGVLYGSDDTDSNLVTIDIATGAATTVGPFNLPVGAAVTGLAFDTVAQTLYGIDFAGAQLVTIDRLTGAAAVVGPVSGGIEQLGWVAGGILPGCRQEFSYALVTRLTPSTVDTGDLPVADAELACSEPFYVEFWARDEGVENTGVTCAFTDILYDPARVQVVSLLPSAAFGDLVFVSGEDDGVGRIHGLGGCNLPSSPGQALGIEPEWVCVARVQMMPLPPGCSRGCGESLTLTSEPSPENESSAYGRGIVQTSDIVYGSTSASLRCTCVYDLTGDCLVGAADLGVLAPSWRKCAGDAAYDPRADFDCSGCVAGGDIGFFATAWLRSCDDPGVIFAPCLGCSPASMMMASLQSTGYPSVQFALRLADAPTSADRIAGELPAGLTSVHTGQRVFAEFWMRDLESTSNGLVAGFAELSYAPSDFRLLSADPSAAYGLMASGDRRPGRLSAWGGATISAGIGPMQWVRVASAELEALLDTSTPQIWLQPDELDPAARLGAGAVLPGQIEVLQAVPRFARADFDRDGDVDQADFGVFQRCLRVDSLSLEPGCGRADLNGDLNVDHKDLVIFLHCASGPGMPADLECGR